MTAPPVDQALLDLAVAVAREAGELTLGWFQARDLAVDRKADGTPVTEADRSAERLVRARLAEHAPGDGVLGEEEPEAEGTTGRRWIVDPIDGTKNYSRGIPVWATLISLERDGVLELGVVSAPALGRRWWAARSEGAYLNGEPIRVSAIAELGDATVMLAHLLGSPPGLADAWHVRAFGDFWPFMLVAEGAVEIAADPVGTLWDLAAPLVVVEEAGGRFTDLAGRARADGGSAVVTNGLLHDAALAALAPPAAG
jgi:histidinol-phosphatase